MKTARRCPNPRATPWIPSTRWQTYGADAIRWYFYSNSAPWLPNRFHDKAVIEGQRKFLSTLWNTYAFFVLYANIDGFDATEYTLDRTTLYGHGPLAALPAQHPRSRRWTTIWRNYRIPETARALQDFVDEMSNWYVRRSRERFWAKGMDGGQNRRLPDPVYGAGHPGQGWPPP